MTVTWRPRNVPVPEAYLVSLAAGLVMHRFRPWRLPLPFGSRHLLAWPLAVVGARLMAGAVRAAGTIDLGRPDRLIITGPYLHSRNPMYVGWALVSLAAGVAARSGWIVAAVPLAAAWTHLDVVREERRLAESFGADFAAYRAAVPRYLGRPRGRPVRPAAVGSPLRRGSRGRTA
jgi:protein-S-isoprenylcysteine O-methyltransferase Ste14